ncbi:unnamed protein product [Closterium sp. NIES-54]
MVRISCFRVPQRAGRRNPQLPPHPRPVSADLAPSPASPPPVLAPAGPLALRVPLPVPPTAPPPAPPPAAPLTPPPLGSWKADAAIKPRSVATAAATDAGRAASSRAGSAAVAVAEATDGSQVDTGELIQ